MAKIRISVIGNINPDLLQGCMAGINSAKQKTAELQQADAAAPAVDIEVFINSWGGDPGTAFAAYNLLRASGLRVKTYNIGETSSAATMIFLAGDERFAAKYSFFKFHALTWDLSSGGPQAAARIGDAHTSIANIHSLQAKLYQDRTTMQADEISGFFLKTVCFSPVEARARGIIDEEREPAV